MVGYAPLLLVPAVCAFASADSSSSSSSPSSSSSIILGTGPTEQVVPAAAGVAGSGSGNEEIEETLLGIDCSRSQSRLVRSYLEKEIWPLLQTGSGKDKRDVASSLPADCPLNPALDLYHDQEKKKTKLKGNSKGHWKCEICGKVFRNEGYLDKHMDLKHHDRISPTADTCLADFCPVFGCSYKLKENTSRNKKKTNNKSSIQTKKKFTNIEPCTEKDVQQRRKQCEAIAESCFNSETGVGPRAESYFVQNVCYHLSCMNGMLKGTIQEHDENAAAWNIFMWVLRCMAVVAVLGFLSIYVFTEKVYLALVSNISVLFGGNGGSRIPKAPQMSGNRNKTFNQLGNWFRNVTGMKKSSKKSM